MDRDTSVRTPQVARRQVLLALGSLLYACSRAQQGTPVPASSSSTASSGASAAQPSASGAPSPGQSACSIASGAVSSAPNPTPKPTASHFERPTGPDDVSVSTIFLDPSQGGPHWIRLLRPSWGAGAGFPLLVALHGLGEAQKGREPGSWGWIRDYHLDRAMVRIRQGELTSADFQGFVDPKRLSRINRSLRKRPFRGVVVACPYTPDLITERSLDNAGPFGTFLIERVLPRIRQESDILSTPASTGLDGVSLGGRLALLVGFARTQQLGAVGTMQTAIDNGEVHELARRASAAAHAASFRLRLLTSDKDFYREPVQALHQALSASGVNHDFLMIPGPHAYAFNRGPGAIEMLLWHDRVLRGEDPV